MLASKKEEVTCQIERPVLVISWIYRAVESQEFSITKQAVASRRQVSLTTA